MNIAEKAPKKSTRNKTITVTDAEKAALAAQIVSSAHRTSPPGDKVTLDKVMLDKVMHGDSLEMLKSLPPGCADMLIADPPYNLSKTYSGRSFKKMTASAYQDWLEAWMCLLPRILKPNASLYICCDWSSSPLIYQVAQKYFRILNRITWEREKGRGAAKNWKNCSEDIWYLSNGSQPKFNIEAVKLKRKVIAPYKENGHPKDWHESKDGRFRLTAPSNLWTDVTVPFWSMPENTAHPTQKPEKLIAKLILASSDEGDVILDPFLGSGTTAVVAKKLRRRFLGIEAEWDYCLLAQKRLNLADQNARIQGYENGVFLERNTQL